MGITVKDLSHRAQEVFRLVVENYLLSGDPVGSKTLAMNSGLKLSSATIRNVMQDLEELGLLTSPHLSAGRVPSEMGLRFFVDGIMQIGELSRTEQKIIEQQVMDSKVDNLENLLSKTVGTLSGLSSCASVVMVGKNDDTIKQIELIRLATDRGLAILVNEDGLVENRILDLPAHINSSALMKASNYINDRFAGLTLDQALDKLNLEVADKRAEIDALTHILVKQGLASLVHEESDRPILIVRGQSHLLEDAKAEDDLDRMRQLLDDVENQKEIANVLEIARSSNAVRIFIGSENKLYSLCGSSVIAAPCRDSQEKVIGVIGIIGPKRLNYARIIPMVDYTARLLGQNVNG